jgi:hypothetical protein
MTMVMVMAAAAAIAATVAIGVAMVMAAAITVTVVAALSPSETVASTSMPAVFALASVQWTSRCLTPPTLSITITTTTMAAATTTTTTATPIRATQTCSVATENAEKTAKAAKLRAANQVAN